MTSLPLSGAAGRVIPRWLPVWWRWLCLSLLLGFTAQAGAAEIGFQRAYQGNLSGQTYTTTTLLNADAGSLRFSDGSTQRTFNNTSGTLYYTIGGVPYAETGVLQARYPNGNVRIDAVAFQGSGGFRLLILGGSYAEANSYSGSSNGILARLNEYIDATAPDPLQTSVRVNGGMSATVPVGQSATVVVTVRLSTGDPLSGATVTLAGSPSGSSTIAPASATSDANGVASFTVQGVAGGTVNYVATASANGTTTQSSDTVTVTYTVASAVVVAPASGALSSATQGTAYSQAITASGGTGPYTFAVTSGALPSGLSLGGAGSLTGTPTQAGSYGFTVTATDSLGATASAAYTLQVAAVTITLVPGAGALPAGTQGMAYTQAITASGGAGPYAYAVTAGALPAGLGLDSNGMLSGTPTQSGNFNFTITGTDAGGATGSAAYSLQLAASAPAPVTILVSPATGPLPAGTEGTAYSQVFTASGGTGPYAFALSGGALPAGLILGSDGTLAGTPTQAGSFSFSVTATDANGVTGSAAYALEVGSTTPTPSVVTVGPASGALAGGTQDTAYNQSFTATGGTGPYTYAVTGGALPQGLVLNTDGTLGGTPTQAGSYSFIVTVTDAIGATGTAAYALQIASTTPAAVVVTVGPASGALAGATQGTAYSQVFTASGGTGPYAFAVSGGALPAGLILGSDGTLAGTPTQGGSFSFSITATDANGVTGNAAYTLQVAAVVVTVGPVSGALGNGTQGTGYRQVLVASGGTGPYTFALTSGALPPGLVLNADGTLSGTPSQAGSYSFTVTVTDATGATGTAAYTLVLAAPAPVTVGPAAGVLASPNGGGPYSLTFTASGGTAPYRFSLYSGTLPVGLVLSQEGVLSGTPTTPGRYTFTILAVDAAGVGTQAQYVLEIAAPTLVITPAAGALPQTVSGLDYRLAFTVSGGTGPYAFSVAAGSLPDGLVLSSAGVLSGTPTSAVQARFTVLATDANGVTRSAEYTLEVVLPPRPDPTLDGEVASLLALQAQAAQRAARMQIGQVRDRLAQVRAGDCAAPSLQDVRVSLPSAPAAPRTGPSTPASDPVPGVPPADDPAQAPTWAAGSHDATCSTFSPWIAGEVNLGRDRTGALDLRQTLVGITVGVDRRLAERATAGVGFSAGRERGQTGRSGSEVIARTAGVLAYGSVAMGSSWFVDGLLGYQHLDYDVTRAVDEAGSAIARGQRRGRQAFAALTFGMELDRGPMLVSAYGRMEAARARLDGFTEQGSGRMDLSFAPQRADMLAVVLGVTGEHALAPAWGRLTVHWRTEYTQGMSGGSDAWLGYADTGAQPYRVHVAGVRDGYLSAGTGLQAGFSGGWTLALDYNAGAALQGQASEQRLDFRLGTQF